MYLNEEDTRIIFGVTMVVMLIVVAYFFAFALWLLDIVSKSYRLYRINKKTPLSAQNFDMFMAAPALRATTQYFIFYPLIIFLRASIFKNILIKLLSGSRIPLRKNIPLNMSIPREYHGRLSREVVRGSREFKRAKSRRSR